MTAVAPEVSTSQDPQFQEALDRVRSLADASVDATIAQRNIRMVALDADRRTKEHSVALLAKTGDDTETALAVLSGAHEQFAEKLDIPLPYYRKMLAEEPSLLAANVNRWLFRSGEEARLLRMLKPLSGEETQSLGRIGAPYAVRAFLSEKYKTIDHYSALKVLAPEMAERAATVSAFNLDPKRFHIRVVTPQVPIQYTGEVVAFGVSLRNSETGHGAVSVEVFAVVVRCVNGIVVDEPLRMTHVGRKNEANDFSWLSAETRRLTDAADILKIRDKIRAGFSDDNREKVARAIAKAAGTPVAEIEGGGFLSFVQNVGKRYDLSKAELEVLQEETVTELVNRPDNKMNARLGAEGTAWNASQAMTATARRIGDGGDFERRVELERVGWKIISDPLEALLRAGKAGSN